VGGRREQPGRGGCCRSDLAYQAWLTDDRASDTRAEPHLNAALAEQHGAKLRADARQARLARSSFGWNRPVRLRDGSAVVINRSAAPTRRCWPRVRAAEHQVPADPLPQP
jgi:hypothetical protein